MFSFVSWVPDAWLRDSLHVGAEKLVWDGLPNLRCEGPWLVRLCSAGDTVLEEDWHHEQKYHHNDHDKSISRIVLTYWEYLPNPSYHPKLLQKA